MYSSNVRITSALITTGNIHSAINGSALPLGGRLAGILERTITPLNSRENGPIQLNIHASRPDMRTVREIGTIRFVLDPNLEVPKETLQHISDVVDSLNRFIPWKPITEVSILENGPTAYRDHAIQIAFKDLKEDVYRKYIAHEMGHALYKVLMSSARSREWNVIFSFCLGSNGFSLVWDRFYMESNPRAGHPFEEPCELFASSVAAFAESPDIFQFFINVVKKDIYKSAGMLLYCYLRDEVFNGIYKDGRFYPKKTAGYEQHAAFRDINWKQLLKDSDVESYIIKAIGQDNEIIRDSAFDNLEKILESDNFTAMSVRLEKDGISVRKSESSIKQDRLIEALIDIIYNKPNIGLRRKALKALGKLTTNDTRIMRPLIHALEDPDKEYCEQAARSCTIKIIEDPIFTPLIGYMLKSSAPLANEKAKYLIGVLGLKTIIKRLIECASHKDPEIRRTAVVAIGLFGRRDKKFIPPLLKALTDDDSYVREEAARAIAVLKLRDPRFLPILLGMLKDEEVDIVGSAMDAIVVQHMRNEYIITSILALLRTDIAHKPLLYELIGKLGIGDTRFIQPLIDATNDELTRYNVEEAIKILCIDKATKKFKRRGLFAFVNKILG